MPVWSPRCPAAPTVRSAFSARESAARTVCARASHAEPAGITLRARGSPTHVRWTLASLLWRHEAPWRLSGEQRETPSATQLENPDGSEIGPPKVRSACRGADECPPNSWPGRDTTSLTWEGDVQVTFRVTSGVTFSHGDELPRRSQPRFPGPRGGGAIPGALAAFGQQLAAPVTDICVTSRTYRRRSSAR